MVKRNYGDIIGGALISAFGLFVAIYSTRYGMGTLQQMGPGYFPRALGYLLIFLGVMVAVPGFYRTGAMPRFQLRSFVCIIASLIFFALTLRTLGLVVATSGTVIIASYASSQLTLLARGLLSVAVTAITYVVFISGLQMILPIWP